MATLALMLKYSAFDAHFSTRDLRATWEHPDRFARFQRAFIEYALAQDSRDFEDWAI